MIKWKGDAILEEAEQPGISLSAVARKYGVNPNQLFHRRKLMREGDLGIVGGGLWVWGKERSMEAQRG